jgi:hypothetical protein
MLRQGRCGPRLAKWFLFVCDINIMRKKKENIIVEEEKPFVWEEYLLQMRESKQRHIQVIAKYFIVRGLSYSSKEEVGVVMKRHFRAASEVAKFDVPKIKKAFEYCQDKYSNIDWTCDTVLKILSSTNL